MIDAVANDALDASEACPCCLLGTQEHCINTPLNNGEMYLDMLKECFDIQLVAANDKCGICSLCAARLRDATDFKRQVLRSQLQLRECLARASNIIEECPPTAVKSEIADDDGTSDNMLESIKAEVSEETEDEDECISGLYPDHVVKVEMVIGPERLQPADITYTLQAKVKSTPESECDEQSRGTGECSDVNPSPDCVRPSQTQEATGADGSETCPRTLLKKSFICQICGKTLKTSQNLKAHIRLHTGEKSYACGMCTQKFKRLSHLTRHERMHTGERPYACGMCTQKFKHLSHLKMHERIHTGEKPYACSMCTQKFKQSSQLKAHERIHTKEKPYACVVCKRKFTGKSHLRSHMQIHTSEKISCCSICNKGFNRISYLKTHERIHTGEKPYCCNVCKKQFADSSSLKRHERIHTGEKPYCCELCPRKFTQSGDLRRHKRSHARK